MDRLEEATSVVKDLNSFVLNEMSDSDFIKKVCAYFDKVKRLELSSSDLKFLKYLSNMAGVPHYYDLLFTKFNQTKELDNYDLNTVSAMIYESSLHVDENIKIHKYQKQVLDMFHVGRANRFFLSATTSFGKTFLVYEIIKKLRYKNIVLIFPTIALLSENFERLVTDTNYRYFYDEFSIHTLSEIKEFTEKNIYIFTPERYLSFIDKHKDLELDFVFVDEIYKLDNEYLIDTVSQENERDTAYRVALQNILLRSKDVLLVGPYIEFPDQNDTLRNQSFNIFLKINKFKLIDFNDYEIVNKTNTIIRNRDIVIDDGLEIRLKGYSQKKKGEQVAKVVSDIRAVNENAILYTKGPGLAETKAKDIINYSTISSIDKNDELELFIDHLIMTFKYKDWIVIQALQNKIGIHHGLVPKYIQKEIVSFFNKGYLDVLISTTTITEGVNTSAKNLIVLSALKGNKTLKTFDAKNIAGRAGRFLHHYSGRVLIFEKKFQEIMNGSDDEIKHKNFDVGSAKNEIDYFITDEKYLSDVDIARREDVLHQQRIRGIPDEIMAMYKVISHSDKISVYDNINALSPEDGLKIKALIRSINISISLDFDGFKVVEAIIQPIVNNNNLNFLIENQTPVKRGNNAGQKYSTLTYILSAYLNNGFMGSVDYKRSKGKDTNTSFRESSTFIFNTLKYQLVKYLGIFNMMYKYQQSISLEKSIDEITGVDKLLLKLEYNATTDKARLASDYGVPSKVTEYYDGEENEELRMRFDDFETEKFFQVEAIFNK